MGREEREKEKEENRRGRGGEGGREGDRERGIDYFMRIDFQVFK